MNLRLLPLTNNLIPYRDILRCFRLAHHTVRKRRIYRVPFPLLACFQIMSPGQDVRHTWSANASFVDIAFITSQEIVWWFLLEAVFARFWIKSNLAAYDPVWKTVFKLKGGEGLSRVWFVLQKGWPMRSWLLFAIHQISIGIAIPFLRSFRMGFGSNFAWKFYTTKTALTENL